MAKWTPVSSGKYPQDEEIVQVTYISCLDGKPCCDEFALRRDGEWLWTDYSDVTVEIIAWKKNCKPYNPHKDYIGEITKMVMDIKFDRSIDTDKHYISPGGYVFVSEGKVYQFDFMDYEGSVNKDDPTILHAEVYTLDRNYSDDLSKFNSDGLEKIEDFYIYTGEGDDPEINPVKVLSLSIEQHLTMTKVTKDLLESIKF